MRTVKASEVVKGMRVRVIKESLGVTTTVEGEVTQGWTQTNPCVIFADGSHKFLRSDHPVTVLAEPEPEWVDGGLYQLRGEDQWHPVIRRKDRWQGFDGLWTDNHEDAPWDVRPAIVVPAPTDEEREWWLDQWPTDCEVLTPEDSYAVRIADALRNQEARDE